MEEIIITRMPGDSPNPPMFDYDAWGQDNEGNIYHELYGRWWSREVNATRDDIELWAFKEELGPEDGGLGKYQHLREFIDLTWNADGKTIVEWNPWLEKLLEEACSNDFLAVGGCSSSGKSWGGALYGIVSFLADPEGTLVLVTSTSISAAKKRIWKGVIQLWNSLPEKYKKLGRIKPSVNMIHYQPPDGTVASDASSINLVAAEQKQEASAVAKLVGLKNSTVILIADELCELSPAVIAATDNLISNPRFQMIAMSNPKDPEDPFGIMFKPKAGWSTIDETCYEWETDYGKAIRFDVLQSPNYLEQECIYKYMLTYEKIEAKRKQLGDNSSAFYRFYRGFIPLQGSENNIYTTTDFNAYMADDVEWKNPPKKVVGIDLSFTSSGDRTILAVCLFGENKEGKKCLKFERYYSIKENAQDKVNPRTEQIVDEVKRILDREGVTYDNVAIDNSGGGISAVDRFTQKLSRDLLRVNFGGKASDKQVSANERIPSWKKYVNRVSELWGVGVEFMRGGQFAGFNTCIELVGEMKARRYEIVKGGDGERILVEPKKKMKARTGRSPDISDALMLAIELCRTKHHWVSEERGEQVLSKSDYLQKIKRFDINTLSGGGYDWQPSF
jgi:hypothetical protein